MELLAVSFSLHRFHQEVFRGNKRQVFHGILRNDWFIDSNTVRHVLREPQNRVRAEEAFGQRNTTVRGISQCPFHPLDRCCQRRIHCVYNQVTGQREQMRSQRMGFRL